MNASEASLPAVLRDSALRGIPHPQKGRFLYLGKPRTHIRYLLLLNKLLQNSRLTQYTLIIFHE